MGRKFKWMIVWLVILGLLYWQQSLFTGAAFAKEEYDTVAEETVSEGEKNPDSETKEDSDEAQENPDSAEEIIERFQIVIPQEDGKNGYYITKPEIELSHVSKSGVTKYRFTDSNGQSVEGELNQENEKASIEKERFQEGKNLLSVWMENAEGERVEEYTLEKEFLIDTKAPELNLQTPQGEEVWYQGSVCLKASAGDGEAGSKIAGLSCSSGDQMIGSVSKDTAEFLIQLESAGGKPVPVTVRAVDRAGNYTEESCHFYIDRHPPETEIEGVQNYMISSHPVDVYYRVTDNNQISQSHANAKWEDPDGNVTILEAKEWEIDEEGYCCRQALTEDGLYQLELNASDVAGQEEKSMMQVIIDQSNPVIRYVDRLHGQYLKNFCWNYPMEEWIWDFTSYTYSIRLDGKLYHMGEEAAAEGGHVLEVKVTDAAGNIGTAKACFTIDHTPPQIIFSDVEEGKVYEEEKTFQIKLSNQEDYIREIWINGESQKTSTRSKIYQYNLQEYKHYEITVRAYDNAGNQTTSRMSFEVVPKETALQKIAAPIKKMFIPESDNVGKEEKKSDVTVKKIKGFLIIGIMAIVIGAALTVWALKRRRGSKKRL